MLRALKYCAPPAVAREIRMQSTIMSLVSCAALASMAGGWCPGASAAGTIRGAGATFPAPLYGAWSKAYLRASGVTVTYDPVGSGAGMERIGQRLVDFGASDAPLSAP